MDIMEYLEQYAEQIGGQFTDYDHNKSVVVVLSMEVVFKLYWLLHKPVRPQDGIRRSLLLKFVNLPRLDLKALLEKNAEFDYSKFVLEEGYIKIEASCLNNSITGSGKRNDSGSCQTRRSF